MANLAKYKSRETEKVMCVLLKHLKQYFTACMQDNAYLSVVEKSIADNLIPRIENLVARDCMAGGIHSIEYFQWQGQMVLLVDKVPFCNFQAAKGEIAAKIGCPFHAEFDRVTEGDKVLSMTEDLKKLLDGEIGKKIFCIRHFEPPNVVNFLRALQDYYDDKKFEADAISEEVVVGNIPFDKKLNIALMQFFTANPDEYKGVYENGNLFWQIDKNDKYPVDHFALCMVFKRKDDTENFKLTDFNINMYPTPESREFRRTEIQNLPLEAQIPLGDIFTRETYPRYEKILKAPLKGSGNNQKVDKADKADKTDKGDAERR